MPMRPGGENWQKFSPDENFCVYGNIIIYQPDL